MAASPAVTSGNPFDPPREGLPDTIPEAPPRVLAPPFTRFTARVIDRFLLVLSCLPAVMLYIALGEPGEEAPGLFLVVLAVGSLMPALVVWQWYRTAIDGTTVGKRASNLRIELLDGRPPGFVRGVLLREWVLDGVGLALGRLGSVVSLVDAVMVFSADGRTVHDHLAGTRVVKIGGAAPSAG